MRNVISIRQRQQRHHAWYVYMLASTKLLSVCIAASIRAWHLPLLLHSLAAIRIQSPYISDAVRFLTLEILFRQDLKKKYGGKYLLLAPHL